MALFHLHHSQSWHIFGFWNTLPKQPTETMPTPNQSTHTSLCSFHYKIPEGIKAPYLRCVDTGQFCLSPHFTPTPKRIFTKSCHKWHQFTEVIQIWTTKRKFKSLNPIHENAGITLNVTSQVYDFHIQVIL